MKPKYYLYTGFVTDHPVPPNCTYFIWLYGESQSMVKSSLGIEIGYIEFHCSGQSFNAAKAAKEIGANAYFPTRHD